MVGGGGGDGGSGGDAGDVLGSHAQRLCGGHLGAVTCVALQVALAIGVSGGEDGTAIMYDTQSGALVRSFIHPGRGPLHALCISGEGEVLLYASDDRSAAVFALNGSSPLGHATFHDGGRVRAILATQGAASPGFFVVAEERAVVVLRSHDLSVCARLRDTGGVVTCAALHAPVGGGGRLEVLLGLESGLIATWVVEVGH